MNGLYRDLVYNKSFTEKCREIAICLKIKLKKLLDIYNRIEISVYGTTTCRDIYSFVSWIRDGRNTYVYTLITTKSNRLEPRTHILILTLLWK